MIHNMAKAVDAFGTSVADLNQANQDDLEALHDMRQRAANTYAELIADLKTVAAAHDADFAKAIARREAMLGEPQSFKMAAE